jgi:hypothetical protein
MIMAVLSRKSLMSFNCWPETALDNLALKEWKLVFGDYRFTTGW